MYEMYKSLTFPARADVEIKISNSLTISHSSVYVSSLLFGSNVWGQNRRYKHGLVKHNAFRSLILHPV